MTRKPTHVRALYLSLATLVVLLSPRLALSADAVGERVGPRAGFAVESEVANRFEPADRPCPADLNGDGLVGHADVLRVLVLWMRSDASGDINEDGIVDYGDLLLILRNWGACECSEFSTDRDGDGTPDCDDGCPDDRAKRKPGACGCGVPETEGCEGGVTGWTEFTESADTRVIYVSSSEGSDSNDGLSPENPVKSLSKGKSLLRNGYPDWMLLKRGDAWGLIGDWSKGGRSSDEPMVVNTYGSMADPRPRLSGGGTNGISISSSAAPKHLAFVGLHIQPSPGQNGFETFATGLADILLEDCMLEGGHAGVLIQPPTGSIVDGLRIRRCVIIDNGHSSDGLGHGIKSVRTSNFLIEENVVDNNGSSDTHEHNMYISKGAGTIVRGNISTRSSNNGLKFRATHQNGRIEGNVFSLNRSAATVFSKYPDEITTDIVFTGNLLVEIGRAGNHGGLTVSGVHHMVVEENILANSPDDFMMQPIKFQNSSNGIGPMLDDIMVRNNTVFNYASSTVEFADGLAYDHIAIERNLFQQPAEYLIRHRDPIDNNGVTYTQNAYHSGRPADAWFRNNGDVDLSFAEWQSLSGESDSREIEVEFVDPHRTLGTYHGALGRTATTEAFIAEARKQERHNWREEYTAPALIAHFRQGFEPITDLGPVQIGAVPHR